jgi:hypothetical protein
MGLKIGKVKGRLIRMVESKFHFFTKTVLYLCTYHSIVKGRDLYINANQPLYDKRSIVIRIAFLLLTTYLSNY